MLKDIQVVHPAQIKRAAPPLLKHLEQTVAWLEGGCAVAIEHGDYRILVRHRRSIAIILIGFWLLLALYKR
jgi:hypothetical protein